MARQSIPANPVDEQILALQRQVASGKNEFEALQDKYEADMAISTQQLQQYQQIAEEAAREKNNLISQIQSLSVL